MSGGFFHYPRFREPCVLSLNLKIRVRLTANVKFIFDNEQRLLNSGMGVLDPGLSALGTGLKDLKNLTNLSLDFQYF